MEVKIPKQISSLKVKHVKAFDIFNDPKEFLSVVDKLTMISEITGVNIDKLRGYKWEDLKKVFDKIIDCLSTYESKELPLELKVDGKVYELVKEFSKLPAGWFIDADSVDFEKNPELLPAFCYIEKGMKYAEKDDNKNILNPLRERAEVFKEEMSLDTFLDLSAFFLQKHKQYKISYNLIQEGRKRIQEKKENRFNGRK